MVDDLLPSPFCVCGHYKNIHASEEGYTCTMVVEHHKNGVYYSQCYCNEFKMDNLRYLEQLSER